MLKQIYKLAQWTASNCGEKCKFNTHIKGCSHAHGKVNEHWVTIDHSYV